MKKLLSILSAVSLSASLGSTVVACSIKDKKDYNFDKWLNEKDDREIIDKHIGQGDDKNYQKKFNYKHYEPTGKSQKSVAANSSSDIKNINDKLGSFDVNHEYLTDQSSVDFKPYADIGIVEDSAEYLLKTVGVGGSPENRQKVEEFIKEQNTGSVNTAITDLSAIKRDSGVSKFVLGFMQQASDDSVVPNKDDTAYEPELTPMWDAAPNKTNNKSAEWFQDRMKKWMGADNDSNPVGKNNDVIKAEDLTISFGSFANAFWHSAFTQNKNPEQLKDILKSISTNYLGADNEFGKNHPIKNFDFYIAAPYLTGSGVFRESQILLAQALRLLLMENEGYTIRLSLVTGPDGFTTSKGALDGFDPKLVGDEMYPFYTFVKYLGKNFVLNLVTGYDLYTPISNDGWADKDAWTDNDSKWDWEYDAIVKATENTAKTWDLMMRHFKYTNSGNIKNRMAITPWIGRRAEHASYFFTPEDAKKLRTYAEKKGIRELSMFYITRDNMSIFTPAGTTPDNWNDQYALDPNTIANAGFKRFTYANILKGVVSKDEVDKITEIKDTNEAIEKDPSFINPEWFKKIDEWVKNNLDGWEEDKYTGPSGPNGDKFPGAGGGSNETPEDASRPAPNKIMDWSSANPVRVERNKGTIKDKETERTTYFSPYLDAGLYEGNNVQEIMSETNLNHLTLAFAQQVNSQSEKVSISIAGMENKGEAYDWWKENQLYGKVLKPFMDKNGNIDNIKVAYGGASTGGSKDMNPWYVAYKEANGDISKAANILEKNLISFQEEIKSIAKALHMPKHIDFDIEGEEQNDIEGLKVLAKTLANMKNKDRSWDFSITLPVLPTGLTNIGYNVLDLFVKANKEQGLSQKEVPITNLMLMDYGDPIYNQAIQNGVTNFDLAKQAIESTVLNLRKSIKENYGSVNLTYLEENGLIGATPMIGVNDTVAGVFSLEDAKELYNWSQKNGIGYIGMWSMNDDNSQTQAGRPEAKSLLTHGLNYLRKYDFARVFSGKWDDGVKNPKTSK